MSGRTEPTEDEIYEDMVRTTRIALKRACNENSTLRSMLAREQRLRLESVRMATALALALCMATIALLSVAANSKGAIEGRAAIISAIERWTR